MSHLFTRYYLLLVVCVFTSATAGAQHYTPEKVNKKATALYRQALERAGEQQYVSAAGLLLQAVELDKNYLDAYIALANVYSKLQNYNKSIEQFQKAFAIDSIYSLQDKLQYSTTLASVGRFTEALTALNTVLENKPPKNEKQLQSYLQRKKNYEFAVHYANTFLKNNIYQFNPLNAGPAINTNESEYFPSLTIDKKELAFTRRLGNNNEDFFSSTFSNAEWSKAKPLSGDINTGYNEGALQISQDGKWLVFTGCNRPDGMGSCDLYIAFLQNGEWSAAKNLGRKINSDQWDSQPCLSPDKREIYFASSRLGGYGGLDIYVTRLNEKGFWSEPENLGPQVNTAGDEQCPFIHADNQTLYFTSNTWPGYGDDDLFFVKKDSTGHFTTPPVNLGYPVNTINKEGTLYITADGVTAYYSGERPEGKGGLDIYSFELPREVRPNKTLWISGKVYDKKTNAGLASSVELINLANNQVINIVRTDDDGDYLLTLPTGNDYVFNVNKKGYLFYSDRFLKDNVSADSTYQKNIALQPIEANASIVLNNVFFDVNKFDIKPSSYIELDKLIQFLNDNPQVTIEISGHTDNVGKPADNKLLSENRAKRVVAYLQYKFIAPKRLSYVGYGETRPVADNNTEAGRAQNRRTEIRITSK
jgi:outer membrane protein OmpA-like peptidoglycan-associated protein/tetratricopeptide (TPR) repeat protein